MIQLCKKCPEPVYREDGGQYVHRESKSRSCAPALAERREAELGIQVWGTEWSTLCIAGTTDRTEAERAATRFYEEAVGEVPDGLHAAVQDATLGWVNRNHPDYDAERWPDDVGSEIERPGDSPLLVCDW